VLRVAVPPCLRILHGQALVDRRFVIVVSRQYHRGWKTARIETILSVDFRSTSAVGERVFDNRGTVGMNHVRLFARCVAGHQNRVVERGSRLPRKQPQANQETRKRQTAAFHAKQLITTGAAAPAIASHHAWQLLSGRPLSLTEFGQFSGSWAR
jgi:hypothetical protein